MADKGILFSAPMVRALLDGRKTNTRRLLSLRGYPGFTAFGSSDTPGYDWHFRRDDGCWCDITDDRLRELLPYAPGDRLYVREHIRLFSANGHDCQIDFAADGKLWDVCPSDVPDDKSAGYFRFIDRSVDARSTISIPSIHMPRWASRLWLEVERVRVERVQSITGADAEAEGITCENMIVGADCTGGAHREITEDRYFAGIDADDVEGFAFPEDAFCALWNSLHTKPGERWEDNPWIVAVSFDVHEGNIDQKANS